MTLRWWKPWAITTTRTWPSQSTGFPLSTRGRTSAPLRTPSARSRVRLTSTVSTEHAILKASVCCRVKLKSQFAKLKFRTCISTGIVFSFSLWWLFWVLHEFVSKPKNVSVILFDNATNWCLHVGRRLPSRLPSQQRFGLAFLGGSSTCRGIHRFIFYEEKFHENI